MYTSKFKVVRKTPISKIDENKICCLDVEQVVLGELIAVGDISSKISVDLKVSDFYSRKNQLVYKAILALADGGRPIDVRTVVEQLKKNGHCQEAGGLAYILGITESIVATRHIEYHIMILKQYNYLRGLIVVAEDILEAVQDPEQDIFDLLDDSIRRIYAISEDAHGYVQDWDNVSYRVIEELKKGMKCISTGYEELDAIIDGWKGGHVVVIGARPGTGKSALIGNMAYEAVRQGVPVAIFSLEMSASDISTRLMSIESGIPIKDIQTGNWAESIENRIEEAKDQFSEKMFLNDTAALEIGSLKSMCRRLVNQRGVRVVFVDYLQLMTVANMPKSVIREQVIAAISRGLKAIAQELNITVVVAAQVNRAASARVGNNRPQLHDLRESGSIEQDANTVIMLYKSSGYGDDGLRGKQGFTELIVAKNRTGKTGTVKLKFEPECCKFTHFDPAISHDWSGGQNE